VALVKKGLSAAVLKTVKFVYVDLNLVPGGASQLDLPMSRQPGSGTCKGSSKPEELAASDFFVERAFVELVKMQFNWFFRFADDSRLVKPIQYDVFEMMQTYGKKYGFIGATRNTPECVMPLWDKAVQRCEFLNATNGGSLNKLKCSDIMLSETKWPRGVDVYNNFEVSHRSVWETKHFKWLLTNTKQVPMSSIVASSDSSINKLMGSSSLHEFGDATIHTLNVLMSLNAIDIHRFRDVTYELTRRAAPKSRSEKHVTTRPLPVLDSYFSPYRFGWLGGDVAASFALPDSKCFSIGSDKSISIRKDSSFVGGDCIVARAQSSRRTEIDGNVEITMENVPSRYVWLFGDSLVGTSSDKR
jgi:hypothetical protein